MKSILLILLPDYEQFHFISERRDHPSPLILG